MEAHREMLLSIGKDVNYMSRYERFIHFDTHKDYEDKRGTDIYDVTERDLLDGKLTFSIEQPATYGLRIRRNYRDNIFNKYKKNK